MCLIIISISIITLSIHVNEIEVHLSNRTGSAVPESVKSLVTEACKKDWDQPLEVSSMKIDRQAFVSAVKP